MKAGAAEVNAPRDEVDPVDNEPRRGRRPAEPVRVGARARYPEVAPPAEPTATVHLDAGQLMAEGDVLGVAPRDIAQPEAGRHAWVVAIWYQVDPLELLDGGRFSLMPDQVVGTLQPTCWFCEAPWSFAEMRHRCPGKAPGEVRR